MGKDPRRCSRASTGCRLVSPPSTISSVQKASSDIWCRLMGAYQQNSDTTPIPQTDLYTSYALRFAAPSTDPSGSGHNPEHTQQALTSLQQADDSFALPDLDSGGNDIDIDPELDPQSPVVHHRLLSPVELITLTRMTFPQCEPAVDNDGKFVIRGLERREGVEKGWTDKSQDMFPFALLTGQSPFHISSLCLSSPLWAWLRSKEPEGCQGSGGTSAVLTVDRAKSQRSRSSPHEPSQTKIILSKPRRLERNNQKVKRGRHRWRGSSTRGQGASRWFTTF